MFSKLWRNHKMLLLGGIAVAALAALYIWGFERSPRDLDLGYDSAARKNPFLAAFLYSQQEGKHTHQLHSLAIFDSMGWQGEAIGERDTLILSNGYQTLSPTRFDNLWRWVHNGGTLIFHSDNPYVTAKYARQDPIFEALQLRLAGDESDSLYRGDEDKAAAAAKPPAPLAKPETPSPPSPTGDAVPGVGPQEPKPGSQKPDDLTRALSKLAQDAPDDQAVYCLDTAKPFPVPLPGETVEVHLSWGRGFLRQAEAEIAPRWWSGPPEQGVLAEFTQGNGRVVVASSLALWRNQEIGCFDHAYLWHYFSRDAASVWLVRNEDAPSLWRQLWDFIPYSIAAFAAALATWLWHHGVRFGPTRYLAPSHGRAFIDHLRANGELLWRTGQSSERVTQLRQQTLSRLQQRLPGLLQQDQTQQRELISALCQLPQTDIQTGLFERYQHSAQEFTQTMATLNLIRNSL